MSWIRLLSIQSKGVKEVIHVQTKKKKTKDLGKIIGLIGKRYLPSSSTTL